MSDRELPARLEVCTSPQWSKLVGPYCFGDLDKQQQRAFEIHLLECESCWAQVEELDKAVEVLRTGPRGQNRPQPNLSMMLNKVFGGHLAYVLPICFVYAFLFGLALFVEISYEFEQFGALAYRLAPFVFLWVFATAVTGLAADWKLTTGNRPSGLWANVCIHCGAATLLFLIIRVFLPSVPTVQANFQTFPVQAGYLKSILYFLFLIIVFWLPSFHFVITMQREILAGRHRLVFAVLTNERWSVTPRWTSYPRFSVLLGLWVLVVVVGLGMTFHLFDNLKPNPNMNLFMVLVETRFFLFFLLGTGCLVWYSRALDLLKRECLALQTLQMNPGALFPARIPRKNP